MNDLIPDSSEPTPDPNENILGTVYAEPALEKIREAVRGNGVKGDWVRIFKVKGEIIAFDAEITLNLRTRSMEKIVGGKKTTGEKVEGPQGVRDGIEKERMRILSSEEIVTKIKELVMERKDMGFGTRNEVVKLPFLNKEYVHHQACRTCQARGEIKCQRCGGKGQETCPRCNGQSMEVCGQCRGSQLIYNGNEKIPCPKCNGQGRTPCMMCNQTRRIPCNTCRTKGATLCQNCNGLAWHSYVTSAEVDVMCTWSYNEDQVPEKMVGTVEARARDMPYLGHIIVIPTTTLAQEEGEQKSDDIPLQYHVRLAHADAEFRIGKNFSVHAFLLGRGSELADIPNFLEDLLKKGMQRLEEAAEGRGNVAEKIQKAGEFRTIRQAIIASSKYSKGKAAKLLAKNTPLGMSDAAIKTLIINADRALNNVTAKPRRNGVFAGALFAGLLYFGYMMSPLRGIATSAVPNEYAHIAIDGVVAGIGMFVAVFTIQMFGAGAMKRALKKLLPPDQKNSVLSKAGHSGLWSSLLCVLMFLVAAEGALRLSGNAPEWYKVIREQVSAPTIESTEEAPALEPSAETAPQQ